MVKGLLVALLASSGCVQATLQSGRTFIAHRDELANAGMEWSSKNHNYGSRGMDCSTDKSKGSDKCNEKGTKSEPKKKKCKKIGSSLTATGFYSKSTNDTDLAYLFGMGTTGAIKVTKGIATSSTTGLANLSAIDTTLYNTDIQHSPNSDGTSLAAYGDAYWATQDGGPDETTGITDGGLPYDRVPTSGTLNFAPVRQVYGAYLGWRQSLDKALRGLSVSVRTPIVQVRTSMQATSTGVIASSIPSIDGDSGKKITDYFRGALTTNIASHIHTSQAALAKDLIDDTFCTATGVADVEFAANYSFRAPKLKSIRFGIGGLLQIPTGNKPAMKRLFEPVYGSRGHIAAGAQGSIHADLFKKNGMQVSFDALVNWKYFFKDTELRTMGLYDITNKAFVAAGQYHLVMQHGLSGVQPAANVLTVSHDVTPRNQIDAVAGLSVEYKNLTVDLGYNFYWRQEELVAMQAGMWKNDKYALAHPHYSMSSTALQYDLVGGTFFTSTDGDTDTTVSDNGIIGRDTAHNGSAYNDTNDPVTKHGNLIGANGDAGGTSQVLTSHLVHPAIDDTEKYPGAWTSLGGPIQTDGKKTSALGIIAANASTGVNGTPSTSTFLTVNFNTSSIPATTCEQMTHSIVGGVSYKIDTCRLPITVGVGGQGEFQASSRNSALEGYKVWAKVGVSF